MYVSMLEIEGFRGINKARIPFQKHSVLIGPNNSGKSTIVDALAMVLGRDRLVRDLSDHDFFGSNPDGASRIKITATLTDFGSDDPSNHPDWFNTQDGAVPFWWDPACAEVKPVPADGSKLVLQIRFCARFDKESLEVETIRYFVDGNEDPFESGSVTRVRTRHLRAIGFFLLPSRRTWDRVLSFSSDLFKRVLRVQEAIPGEAILRVRDWLRTPDILIEEDEALKNIVHRLESELAGYVGTEGASITFRPTTGDIPGILGALTPYLPGKSGCVLPLGRHGSGVISLQTLLLLIEIGRARQARGENFILVAEEPELHLHPGHHRRLVARIQGLSEQSILTTHSPEIAAYARPQEIVFLRNNDGELVAQPLESENGSGSVKNIWIQLFTVRRQYVCEALMGGAVIVPEGITEFRWLRLLTRATAMAEGWSAVEDAGSTTVLGVIPTPDARVVEVWERLSKLNPGSLPLVDGDSAGHEYTRKLQDLNPPPLRIARLGDGGDLERVLAWILLPDEEEEWADLEDLLDDLTSRNIEALWSVLGGQAKTRYDLHEALAGLIATRVKAAERARKFLDALIQIAMEDSPSPENWSKDEDASSTTTEVWRWNIPAES